MSLQSTNPGAVSIRQSLGQELKPVGQALDQLRAASENRFGDGWTTAGFTAAQATLEADGFLGGVAAIGWENGAGRFGHQCAGGQYTGGCDAGGVRDAARQGRGVSGGGCRRVGGADCTNRESDTRRGRVWNHTRLPRGRLEAVCNVTTREDPCLRKPRAPRPKQWIAAVQPDKERPATGPCQLFKASKPFVSGDGAVLRYALDATGAIHRFEPTLPDIYHWSGSTRGLTVGGRSRPLGVPAEVWRNLDGN
jgi:hypothetical protein